MSIAYSFSRFLPWLSLLIALTVPLPGTAADLTPDKSQILIGETVYVKLDARLVLNAKWSASDELQILASDSKGATVKGAAAGQATLNVKWLGGKKSTRILVLAPDTSSSSAAPVALPPYNRAPLSAPALPDSGTILFASEASSTGQATVFRALNDLANSNRSLDLAQAREFFRLVQSQSGSDGNVWNTLRAVKRNNKTQWDAVSGVENQLVALVRDTLVRGREGLLRRGNLGTVFAFLDSGKWRNRAIGDLQFDTDFDTTFFADRLTDVDPDGRDNIISRVEDLLAQQLGVGSRHLGIELTGYGYESKGDNYVSKSGIKWALRESASHMHLIDPVSGRIGANIHQHPNVLFARQQNTILRQRHPELFDASGRLLPNVSRAEVQRILQSEPGLSRNERMFSEGSRMNLSDAALAPIDMACHLSETRQSTNPAEDIAKISKQVARSTAVYIEGMGGGAEGQRGFTPAEMEFMRLTRQLETAKIERAYAEAQVARFMAANPPGSPYTDTQIAELDRLLGQARDQKALVESSLQSLQSRWSPSGVHQTAITVMKKQARAGFDATLRHLLSQSGAERTRGLGDFAREMEVLSRHYESKGAPAEMLKWARQGLETSLILHEMSRDPRFSNLWSQFERIARSGPREVARLKDLLNNSEAGRRLLSRVGVALDNIVNPPKELALGHPMAEASRSLREIAGSYTALVGHTALIVGLVDAAYQAKTNEEFAITIGQTLIGTTTVGLILQEGQQLILGGDLMAGARLLAYILVPESALPALVEALGHSTINLGTAIAFDTQLDALYLVSKFDKNGALTEISGYPRGDLASMLALIAGPGGYKTLEDMINRAVKDSDNFFAEQAKGINLGMKHAVVNALNSTFLVGKQMVFKDDGTLSAIIGNVHKFQEEIKYLTKTFGIEAPLGDTRLGPSAFTATANDFYPGQFNPETLTALDPKNTRGLTVQTPHWAATLDRGQLRALAQLFVTRDWWGNEGRKAFIETLVRTLEERHRAEKDVDAELREQKRKDLMARFAELEITEEGTVAYEQEAGYHLVKHIWNVTLGFATPRERQVHEMKALNRYLDVYNHVRDLRFVIEAEISRRTGQNPVPRPLTGIPSLAAVPAIDYPAAENLAREIGTLGDELARTLTLLKGGELEGDYDTRMFKRIYEAKYQNAYWSEARKSTLALKDQVARWKIVATIDLYGLADDCFKRSQDAWKTAQDLIQEFKDYYANLVIQGDIQITPTELTEGDRFSASVNIRKGAIPRGARWTWQADGGLLISGTGSTGNGTANGSGTLRVKVSNATGKTTLAEITRRVVVTSKTDNVSDTGTGGRDYTGITNDPVETYVPTCSYQYSDWSACNRETKKQTRTVTGKTPAKCEERQKPATEQGCTPPPTAEELKHRYLNCLCRCYSGWAGHIGVWYDPEGKSIPECKSNGPCFGGAGAFGCTRRHFFGAPNDCSKSCWEGVYGKDGGYESDKANKLRLDENKKYKKPLIVKLKASKNPADFGDIVDLIAEASEGSGGYRYDWGGCAQDAKDASAKVTNTRQCKPCTANVTVTDQDGDSASDSLLVQCTALTVKLTKERPADDAIPIGGKAELFAEVFSGDKSAGGSFVYYWEPNPDVQYGNDPKNPAYETKGGAQSRNTAIFRQLGRTPVWVTVLKQVGETRMTMGESEQIQIEVISPQLSLKASKPNPVVGEEVVITVEEKPRMSDDMIRFWWEYKGDANNPGVHPNTPNSRSWSYKPKNDRPVTVTVHAKAADSGDALDSASLTIAAQKAQVTVTGPRIAGPAPMIWKEGVGLVAAERQVSEHQRVEFSATVSPSAGDLRYQWRAEPSGCSIHSPSSKDTGVTCSSTGSYALTVTVKNADGAELGSGTGNLSVSISQAQIKQGQQKAEASKTLDQAKQAWSAKGFDRAVSLAEEAARTDPAMAQPTLNQFSQGLKQQGWDALNKGERATAIDKLEKAVRLNPNDADARQKLADARDHVAKWPQVEVKVREFDDQIRNKRIWSAQATMLAMQDILRTMAAGQSSNNPTWRKVQDDFNTGIAEYNRFSQEKTARHTQYFKEKNYAAMLANAESMRERELSPADEKECQSRIDFAKLNLQGGQNDGGVSGGGIHSVNSLGNSWDKLSAVGGNFDRFARFDGRGLSVDVPAGNSWGKTGLMAKQPMVKLGKTPVTVTVAVDPARTSGFVVAFAATRHPDVALTNNAWMSWVRNDKGSGDLWIGNVQDAWAGRNKGVSAPTSGQAPTPFVFTLEPGRMTVRAAGQAPVSVEIGWLKEGVDLYPHLFTHPTEAGKAASLALTSFAVAAGGTGVGSEVAPSGQASLRLAQTRFVQGEPIQVHFTAPATWPGDAWVGIIPSTVAHGSEAENDRHDITYQYLKKRASGTLTFSAPAPGNWDFRLHDTDSNGKEYASVSFQSVAKGQAVVETTPPQPPIVTANAKLVLEDDLGPYKWIERTEVQTAKVRSGRAAFRSTGNNHFTHRLGLVGNYPGMYRYLDLWLWFDKPGADIQIAVQVDGTWGKRWGFEAGPKYDGYGWTMEGSTVNQPAGRWVNLRLDLIEQLNIHAGQAITGLAFSSDHGDVFYDTVQLLPSSNPLAMPVVRPDGKRVLEDDVGPYKWGEATQVQKEVVANGQAAFRSTGNNHFTADLGLVGDYDNQFRSLSFWVFMVGPEADIQIALQVDGTWGKRWGYEAGPKYNGYGWTMEGSTANLRPGVWQELKIDLIRDLKINPGQRITGLAFSSDNGDVYYDTVYLQANPNPVARPTTAPTGKRVLEDDLGPYKWLETTQVQREVVAHGQAAFRSTGNNHFTGDLGRVGDYPELFRTLTFWAYFMGPTADLQLGVQVDGSWGKRWGYEAGPKYDGYGWSMEGSTANLRPGVWQELKIDLIRDLKINPGQKITGLAFSSDNNDVYYDAVYLQPNPNPALKPSFQPTGKQVLEDDLGPYKWGDRSEVQDYLIFRGSKAYRSTGNNHFTADLGIAGNAAGQFQSVGFWAFFMGPKADIQLGVQVNGTWGKRWGFDAGPKYDGYGWAMQGTTANLPNGRWTWIQVDLINQLKLKAGDKITGLAFSSDNGDVIYDSVWLLPSGARPGIGTGGEAGPIGDATPALPPVYDPPGGRDYTFAKVAA
jgi:tetratricopeptide (TPR) repeat protein